MKQIISSVAIAGLFTLAACSNTSNINKDLAIQAQQHTIDSMNIELTKKKVIDSMNEVSRVQYFNPQMATPVVQQIKTVQPVATVSRKSIKSYSSYSGGRTYARPQHVATRTIVYEQAPQRRKGWSAKAKGAVIGAGTGAAVGALVNGRNRLAGGVIGSLIGAAGGTGIGAIIDRRNGR